MIQEVYLIDNDDKIKDKLVKMFEKEEDYNTSLKALDMLGKIVGAYQPEQQVNILINQSP